MSTRVSGPNGGDLLTELMKERGIDAAFGIVSVHNLPLVDAVSRDLRFVPVRHEAAAVNAADGYGRARGGIGVALTSTGTGAGNAAGAMVEALTAGMPLLHVTGQIDSAHLGHGRGVIHETKDQLGMLRAISKHARTILDTASAAAALRDAFVTADSAPRGPVSIEWPVDLQYLRQMDHDRTVHQPATSASDSEEFDQAAELLTKARRPLVWAGGGAVRDGDALSLLLDRLGAGLLTSNAGRGVIAEDDPRCIGNFASNPECAPILREADLLLSIGTHHRSNETNHYTLKLPDVHIQIDVDPSAPGRAFDATVGIIGGSGHVIRALLDRLADQSAATDPDWGGRIATTRLAVRADLRAAIGPQVQICDGIRNVLPRSAVIARDVTIPVSAWGNRLLEIYDWRSNISPRGGGIGQGLAMGIGAAISRPDEPVAVLAGDGGLSMHLGELVTLAQEQPWLTLVVFNDNGYGVMRNMQDQHFTRRAGVDLFTPDFRQLADAVGVDHHLVAEATAFEKAFAIAIESRRPAIIEVDIEGIGPMPRPFTPPVHIAEDA
jgi:acetolactate synthase-1/2/3 large subunit